jgi:Ca2+-binding RTX toxin-like protein
MRRVRLGFGGAIATALILGVFAGLGSAGKHPPKCDGDPATIVGTPGPDVLVVPPGEHDAVVVAFGGDDEIRDHGSQTIACGRSGDDQFHVRRDALRRATFFGGPGDDLAKADGPCALRTTVKIYFFAARGMDVAATGRGYDRLEGGSGGDVLGGCDHGDRIDGGRGADRISGYDGDDRLLNGGEGNDAVLGGNGAHDIVDGDEGDDLLRGGPGDRDLAVGGPGIDRCNAEAEDECEE